LQKIRLEELSTNLPAGFDLRRMKENLIKLEIYYADLDVDEIIEYPSYPVSSISHCGSGFLS
jgi:hypothetical protein